MIARYSDVSKEHCEGWNAVEDPEMMFDEWFNQWREMSPKYIIVDLSLHTSLIGKQISNVISKAY